MIKNQIESLPEIIQASQVLQRLEGQGLLEPVIASGWTRGFLTDITPSDIDISYVGPVPFLQAQTLLTSTLNDLCINKTNWDIQGIWNAQTAYGVTSSADHIKRYYLSSIDSVYLASDGHLHDSTGFGFADSLTKTLRLNNAHRMFSLIPKEQVNDYLEGCRRIAKFGWTPTPESVETIKNGVPVWQALTSLEKNYFIKKLAKKFQPSERASAQKVYDRYGWGWIFDNIEQLK